jgi:hypothetical protein
MQRCEFQTLSLLLGSGKQSAASVLLDAHDQLISKVSDEGFAYVCGGAV